MKLFHQNAFVLKINANAIKLFPFIFSCVVLIYYGVLISFQVSFINLCKFRQRPCQLVSILKSRDKFFYIWFQLYARKTVIDHILFQHQDICCLRYPSSKELCSLLIFRFFKALISVILGSYFCIFCS